MLSSNLDIDDNIVLVIPQDEDGVENSRLGKLGV